MQNDLFGTKNDNARTWTDDLGITHDGAPIIVAYGAGVDSTAMLIAMKRAGVKPDLILFADTGGEKPETYAYCNAMDAWLESWSAPSITWVNKKTSDRVNYTTLEGNCLSNETLPSLAFGMHSCSIKWKAEAQDGFVRGVSRGPNKKHGWQPALESWAIGNKPLKLIGYDNGKADLRRRNRLADGDDEFRFVFPLQNLGWARGECVQAILEEGLAVPIKSACFFCPASKKWELWWLAGHHPDLFMRALEIERNALQGRHSRWDKVEFGENWPSYLEGSKRFPSVGQAGLGRGLSWNQWAVENGIVTPDGVFIGDQKRCREQAAELCQGNDNAQDVRAA